MKNIILIICYTIILLPLSYAQCDDTIDGTVITEEGDALNGAQVNLMQSSNIIATATSNTNGEFTLTLNGVAENLSGLKLQVSAPSNNPLSGVSTLDMVIIIRHILGIDELPLAVNLIQADTNCDGIISALDLVYMRRMILGVDEHFPDGDYCGFSNQGINIQDINIQDCKIENLTSDLEIIAYYKGNVSGN